MNAKGKSLLKIVGIIYIIIGFISTVSFFFMTVFKNLDLGSELSKEANITTVTLVIFGIEIINLFIVGYMGIKYCNAPKHANMNLIFGGIALLFTIYGVVNAGLSVYSLLGFILPLLYLTGAFLNKKMDLDEFNEQNDL